jgi:hypothetical protein
MLSALNDSQDSFDELAKCIDPNLTSYDKDSLYEVWLISTFSCAFEVLRSVWLLSRNKKKKKVETEWKCLGNSLFEQIYFKSLSLSLQSKLFLSFCISSFYLEILNKRNIYVMWEETILTI